MWITRLDQGWGMFSPHPPKSTFWYVIVGQLVNDETVELFRNGGKSRSLLSHCFYHFFVLFEYEQLIVSILFLCYFIEW
jgi:hypothetical protein